MPSEKMETNGSQVPSWADRRKAATSCGGSSLREAEGGCECRTLGSLDAGPGSAWRHDQIAQRKVGAAVTDLSTGTRQMP